MLRLRTFGGLAIERSASSTDAGTLASSATGARRRLALLAVLAANGRRGVPRDKLLALFWPESDTDRARHALDQTLYALKRDLGAEALVIGREEPALNPAAITSDVEDFNAALARGDRAAAVELQTGPFLDGVFLSGAPDFEQWAEEERGRLTRELESALEALATEAARRGDHAASVQRWQRLAAMEPRKTRVVLALMSELAASGDRASALRHAEIYNTLVKDDLEAAPNPAIATLAEKIKREPPARQTAARERVPPDGGSADCPRGALPPDERTAAPRSRRSRLTVEWLRQRTTRAYRVAGVSLGLALLLALSLAWIVVGRRHETTRGWILAADFENRTREPVFDRALDAALAAGLQQSAGISIFPRARVQQTLMRMARPQEARVDEALAREIAQREGIGTVVAGAIDRVDSSYMLTARLVDARSGNILAAEAGVAKSRAAVIDAVDDLVRRLRRDAGESAAAIAKHDLPLPLATTRSLEALRKYADGVASARAGQRRAATELWQQAVALDSDFALAHAELGAASYWTNDRPTGDAHFAHALRLLDRLTDRERLLVRAAAQSWRGNREGAIELRKALLALYPDDRSAWGQIGYDYMRLGRGRDAVAALQQQLTRDSTNPSDYINLASAYKQLGDYDASIRSYRRAFLLQPSLFTLENINHEYGGALVLAGRLDDARAAYDTMLLGDPQQQARGHRSLGLLAMVRGRYGEAIDRFRQAALHSQRPGSELTEARNRLFLVAAEQEKGWRDSARAELRTAHALFRKSYFEPAFLMYLGKALARERQLPLAVEVLDSLRRRSRADNQEDHRNEQVLAAEITLARGRPDSAVRLLRLAYAADSNVYVTESFAHALSAAGDLTAAAQLYESLLGRFDRWYGWEAEQYGLTAPLEAGVLYERLGNRVKARSSYELLLSRWSSADTDLVSIRLARAGVTRLRALDGRRENPR